MFTKTRLFRDYPSYEVGSFYEEPLAIDENPVYDDIYDADFDLEVYFNTVKYRQEKSRKRKRDDNDSDSENKKIKKEQ